MRSSSFGALVLVLLAVVVAVWVFASGSRRSPLSDRPPLIVQSK